MSLLSFLYATLGLLVGGGWGIAGVILFLKGTSRSGYKIKVAGFEIDAKAPGLAFAFLGLLVIWLTKP